MKIELDKRELEKCYLLLNAKENNLTSVELIIDYLNNHYNDISNIKTTFLDAFLDVMEIDKDDPEYKLLEQENNINQFRKLDKYEFENNKYYKLIKSITGKNKDWDIRTLKYNPYEAFVYDEISVNSNLYQESTPIGYFTTSFSYPAVIQNDEIWMSLIPHEINTMKQHIKDAFGNVLVLGLGLGYYAYEISNKNDVNSIIIIEKDENVIELFNKLLFDKFENKSKIKIIHLDALEYLKNIENKFDFVFTDIYHNVHDGEPLYLAIKKYENKYPNIKFEYWIEESLLAMVRRQLLTVFEECVNGAKEADYLKARNNNDKIINSLYFATKDITITSFEQLHTLLSNESINNIIKKM